MRWINRLERKYGRLGIPNLIVYVTATMLAVFVLGYILKIPVTFLLQFDRSAIFSGQIWRVITFLFIPLDTPTMVQLSDFVWLLFGLYLFYIFGSELENKWGTFRFTFYYVCGTVGAIIAGMISGYATNTYLNLSILFAFANLFPDFEILLLFLVPVKIKYLAYLNAIIFLISFIFGNGSTRLVIVFSLINYFIFFGPEQYQKIKTYFQYSKGRREFRRQMRDNQDRWQ